MIGASRPLAMVGQPTARLNVTPMIDVVMCLIIFFLIVGKLAADKLAAVDLPPGSAGAEVVGLDPVIVNLLDDGGELTILVDGFELSRDRLGMALEPGRTVEIRASRSLPYGLVKPVLTACREAGVGSVSLATEGV